MAGLPFCSGNCADLFVDTEGWGIPFRMIIFSFPYSSIIWPQLLRSVVFISENGFGGCPRRSERERRPTTHNEKKAKARFTEPLKCENRFGQTDFRFFLFPVFEQFVHNCIHCCFQTLFHHLKKERFHHRLLFLLAFLFLFLFVIITH